MVTLSDEQFLSLCNTIYDLADWIDSTVDLAEDVILATKNARADDIPLYTAVAVLQGWLDGLDGDVTGKLEVVEAVKRTRAWKRSNNATKD